MPRHHVWDDASGWCLTCQTYPHRDDGRRSAPGGTDLEPGPNYTPDQLAQIQTRIQTVHDRRYPR
ncbi:hypothetical protein [Microbacterium rhizophilus]|uniref:hypothetical protein n=1 Tax=Microbacterium rhizophilus TaxID=3138934 RepID=UPI0031EFDCD0